MKDLIERQKVMDAIYKCTDIYVNNLPIMIYKAELYKAISELPSAQPERAERRSDEENLGESRNEP